MMADVRRLVEAGIAPDLALELAAQINSGVARPNRLAELGMVPPLSAEIARQITSGVSNAGRLVELSLPGVPAREVAGQISGTPPVFPNNVLAFSNGDHPVFTDGTYLRFAA